MPLLQFFFSVDQSDVERFSVVLYKMWFDNPIEND